MLEVYVPPEEFLRQMAESDSWMPESHDGATPAMYIRKEGTRIRVIVSDFPTMDNSIRINFLQRLDLLRTAPEIAGKRRY